MSARSFEKEGQRARPLVGPCWRDLRLLRSGSLSGTSKIVSQMVVASEVLFGLTSVHRQPEHKKSVRRVVFSSSEDN